MSRIVVLAALLLASFAGGFVSQQVGPVQAGERTRVLDVDELRCRSITVTEPNNPRSVSIVCNNGCAGVFIQGKHGRYMSIIDYGELDGYAAVGIYADLHKGCDGFNYAIYASRGEANVQWITPTK